METMKKQEDVAAGIAHEIVEGLGKDLAAALVEYANLVKQLAEDLTYSQVQNTAKIKELLEADLPDWDEEDWEDLRAAVAKRMQDDLEEWQQKKATVTMTNEEWGKLTTYLLMSTNHRKGEAEAWENLAKETNEDGSTKFKNAASNAEFWREMMATIESIRKKIDDEKKYEA